MRNYPKFYYCFLTLLVLALIPNLAGKTFAQNPPAEWTLMFYMDSDNNLEAAQMQDLEEMMAVGSSENVNIIVLVDRSNQSSEEDGYTARAVGGLPNWTTAKLVRVEKGRLRELSDWGEVNMGDPNNLKKFLQTVPAQFPAKHYGLVFGDHGAGWIGIVSDESANGDSLDTNELPAVFKETSGLTGKLDLIGFDACMMANFEAAKSIAPFGKTMVGSEELEPGNGWNYTPLMASLVQNPQMDSVALGKRVVDTYRDFYLGANEGNRDKTVTLAVIDLEKIPALETAVSNLGIYNQSFMKSGGRATWLQTAQVRSRAEEYGVHNGEHEYLYDLLDYAENLKREKVDAQTLQAADAVIAAVKSAVLYKINGAAHPHSNGLSIYFPPDAKKANGDYRATPFSVNGKWLPFLADYMGVGSADNKPPQITQVNTTDNDIAKSDVVTVTSKVNADDIEEATFVLAQSHEEGEIIIGAIPTEPDENGVLKEEWDGSWFSIGDGKKEMICPITNFEEIEDGKDEFLAEVPAQIRYHGSNKWRDVTLYFYLDFKQEEVVGEFVYAFEFKNNRAREIDVEDGDSIRPVYLVVDKDGNSDFIASDDPEDILNVTKDDDITVGEMDVEAGKYLIGFTVTDFSGNTNDEFTEVTIE
ncbi:MAG: hypothetical protein K1X72_15870 [Pyrinomonadaceae bacterium]|nr:hypothetical protein [Pyrinomonadaceae bacterium]